MAKIENEGNSHNSENEKGGTSWRIDWGKVKAGGQELNSEQRAKFNRTQVGALLSANRLTIQACCKNDDISEMATEKVFNLFAEVTYDLMEAFSVPVEFVPNIIPSLEMSNDKAGAYVYDKSNGEHTIFLNSSRVISAIHKFEYKDTKELAKVVYVLAHEMGHLRQNLNLPYFKGTTIGPGDMSDWEQFAKYKTGLLETNANAIAIRYIGVKKELDCENPIWNGLDFKEIISHELELLRNCRTLVNFLTFKAD